MPVNLNSYNQLKMHDLLVNGKIPIPFCTVNCTASQKQEILSWNQNFGLTGKHSRRILLLTPEESGMSELVAYVDGGSLGNPGPSGIGVIIDGGESGPIRIAKWIGHQDNNVAEYVALMEALQYAVSKKARALHVYSDSEVVVRQMRGEYICRSSRLYSLHWTCRKLARALSFSISHVPRESNAEANQLANTAVRGRIG
jgi:ribonuclease HI